MVVFPTINKAKQRMATPSNSAILSPRSLSPVISAFRRDPSPAPEREHRRPNALCQDHQLMSKQAGGTASQRPTFWRPKLIMYRPRSQLVAATTAAALRRGKKKKRPAASEGRLNTNQANPEPRQSHAERTKLDYWKVPKGLYKAQNSKPSRNL